MALHISSKIGRLCLWCKVMSTYWRVKMWDDSEENKRFLRFSLTRKRQIPRVILYCAYAQKRGYETVRIRSPDSDIFFILLHHVSKFDIKILLDTGSGTGSGNNRKLIDISDLSKVYGQELCTALMSLHAFTHCDTSAFKGIGKIRPIKLLLKHKGFQDALSKLGDTWEESVVYRWYRSKLKC